MHKPLIAALLLLFAASAAATPDAYALHQINSTHWHFESTQYDLAEGDYTYQAFANNISTSQNTVSYTLRDGLHQINSTHWYFKASKTSLPDGTHNYQAFANNISSDYRILDVDVNTPPASITNLQNATGNFWHNWTWTNPADADFNYTTIYINGSWITNTSNEYYNLSADAHNQSTISTHTVDVNGNMNSTWVNHTSIIPNNPVTITNTSDWSGDAGENVYVDYDASDLDSDTPTFSCNRTDLFADFDTATGKGNWTATAGTYYIDFGVADGWGSTSNYTMTISANMTVTLLSQTPSTIYQNTTGLFNQTWGIEHPAVGLNNTSASFIFSLYDIILDSRNHSIRPPNNDKATMYDTISEQILRAVNRNESLNFESNDTITGGNIYGWGGYDENTTEMTIELINSTYTKIHINDSIATIACSLSWYLDRSALQTAAKTAYAIDKSQHTLIKIWDLEAIKGVTHSIAMNIDTSLGALSPSDATPLNIFYLNDSYDPLGGVDPKDSPYALFVTSLNATQWLTHTYSPTTNASYTGNIIINSSAIEAAGITITNTAYIYLKSDTPSSKPFYINTTNEASGTNVSFADTGVMWSGIAAPYTTHSYTPNIFLSFLRSNHQLQTKLYVADNDGTWANSTLETTDIEISQYPPTNPSIDHFHYNGTDDSEMNHTYSGLVVVHIGVATDPDYGDQNVSHNLTLRYANKTIVAIINDTFNNSHVVPGEVFAHIDFDTSPYYSSVDEYTLKVVATDDEGETATTWLGVNFSLNQNPNNPTLVAPANGAVGTSTNPTLRVTVTDPDGDPMNVTFYQQGGTQIGSTQTAIANGSTASVIWTGRSYSTTYYWYAVAHDGYTSNQSDTWHFTTQATGGGGGGGGVTHDIAITGCTNWNGNAGTNASIDFGYINDDADSPTFTTNATEGTLDAATGVWTWATTAGDVGTYSWYFRVTNAYGNSDQCTVTITVYATTTPLNLDATTGNFWVQHTWDAVTGATGYNVSINGIWHNQTATNYLNTLMSPHGWSNITLASYNGTMSSFIADNVQIPNNPIAITNYSDQTVTAGDNVTVDLDYTDLDGDTPTFSCSRTDLFTDFDTATGTGNWTTAANGTFEIGFGVSDGYGSTSNCTITVQVGSTTITESPMPIQMFALMFGMMILLIFYSFIRVDENNYTHILTAFAGGILSILLGLEVFDGIDFYGSTGWIASCSTGWIGLFLCAFGGIMILYAVVHAIDVVRTASEKL